MPSHSVKQAKVMSAIAHGWHPSDLDIPVKVAKDFHAADAGHKYGKGMDKKAKALSATKHYRKARGGSIEGDGKDDVSYGGTLPRSLQPMTTQIPDSWLRAPIPKYRYADGGDVQRPFGVAPMVDSPSDVIPLPAGSPMVGAKPAGVVGPLRSRILDAAYSAAGGRWNARAKISDIQKKLPDVPIDALHNEMKLMQLEEKATLMPMDNVRERTPADNESALRIGGNPRHILWVPRDPREMASGGGVGNRRHYADGGDVDWSKLNQPFGELKGTSPQDTPVQFKTTSPYVNITEGDIDRAMNIGMGAGPGVMVGPYGAHMLRAANRAAIQPHPVIGEELKQRAAGLRPEFQDIYKGAAQDMRDAEARANLEMRQGSQNPSDRDIFARSGWSRGSEGMARKEIPDTGAKLVPLKGTDRYLLQHPAGNFHEIYDVPPIKFDPSLKEDNGQFYQDTNQIIVGGSPTETNKKKAVSVVLHELQHAIQKKEGFAYGSNLTQAMSRPELHQEIFPNNMSTDELRKYGPRNFVEAPIPSWQEKLAERQRNQGGDPASEANAMNRALYATYQRSAGETEARNVQNRRIKSHRYMTHPEHTEDVTRGLQWEDTSMMPRTYEKAGGGSVGNFNPERGAAIGLSRQGIIKSSVPGRTDKLNLNVPSGSYVIPADIPSALGQGNTTAGGAILDRMFNKGPYGMNLPRAKGGSRVGQRKSSLSKQSFAEGGDVGQITPILAAGGEYMVHPETVSGLGNGDMDLGHSILDSFVKQVRAKHISTLKNLKPPKGSS